MSLTKRYIFHFTKYEHKGFTESIGYDMNFFSVKPQQNFQFFILFQECVKYSPTYILDILTLFEYTLRVKI